METFIVNSSSVRVATSNFISGFLRKLHDWTRYFYNMILVCYAVTNHYL